jgi:ATP-dependent helicase HepA
MAGRISIAHTLDGEEAYYVEFPNLETAVVHASELRVRWKMPLLNPLPLLKTGTVETRYFHTRRTRFLRNVAEQRSAVRGLGGLLSSAVEIHEHQVGAARRVLTDPIPRYLLADEVGLGKTIEAGMVIRQLLLDGPGQVLVVVPDQLVEQWRAELITKFRVGQFTRRVRVIGHSRIEDERPDERLLTVVDEAHRFTDHVAYDKDDHRLHRYQTLAEIAHSSSALLLLSATPVRSNEDAFLGLLHLLDAQNYPLSDVQAFRQRVSIRDDLALAMSALDGDLPLRYLDEPLEEVAGLLPDDELVGTIVPAAMRAIEENDPAAVRTEVGRLRLHVSETYRLHRRMIRNRRSSVAKKSFPVRGRTLAEQHALVDPDARRRAMFALFDDVRLELELSGRTDAGRTLQVLLGRFLAPAQALSDLVAALREDDGHDLSPDEIAAVVVLEEIDAADELARRLALLLDEDVPSDRISAMCTWARQRATRGKHAIVCTYPNTARIVVEALVREVKSHRVTALLEGQSPSERSAQIANFERSSERAFVVLDRSAEEGVNLQMVEEVLHLDTPTSSSHLEQRLGRFDRWSEIASPIRSVLVEDAEREVSSQFDAWTRVLTKVFGAYTSSTATLQYVLADIETEFFTEAVTSTLADAEASLDGRAAALEVERRRITGQDSLDSIEDRAEDEELADRIAELDAKQQTISDVAIGYIHEMLGFEVGYPEDGIRFQAGRKRPPLLTETEVKAIGVGVLQRTYTADRIDATAGRAFVRWGEPLVNAFSEFAEGDDRGRAFAVEITIPELPRDERPTIVLSFDIKVGPNQLVNVSGANEAFVRAVKSRAEHFMPTTVARVWWTPGRGACTSQQVKFLETHEGENLGSRLERFRELVGSLNWERLCETSFAGALSAVQNSKRTVDRVKRSKALAEEDLLREHAILAARQQRGDRSTFDQAFADGVDHALSFPTFSLESCGAVFITGTGN